MRRQILTAKSGISNHAAAGIRDDPCLSKFGALHGLCPTTQQTILELLCVSLMVTSEQNITARSRCLSRICPIFNSRCRRVRFARFYIVCEEVPLGTPESPLIVCGLSDTFRECSNVEETRNGMPTTAWKKYVNFASKNLPPSVYSGTFLSSGF